MRAILAAPREPELFTNSLFTLALCAGLGFLVGALCGRLIGAGRDATAVLGLFGLTAGVVLFGIGVNLSS